MAENDIIQSRTIVGKLMSSSLRIQCEEHSEEEGGPRCSAAADTSVSTRGYSTDAPSCKRGNAHCLNVCLLRTGHRTFHAADFFPTGVACGAAGMVLSRDREMERPPLSVILPQLYLGAESDVTQVGRGPVLSLSKT